MNLDRASILFAISQLSILWSSLSIIYMEMVFFSLLFLWGMITRNKSWLVTSGLILINFYQIQQIAKNAENVTASQSTQKIRITKILKQESYQTAIGKTEQGKQFYLNWQVEDTPLILSKSYQATLKIRPISGRLNEGNFDRQQWLLANRFKGTAVVKKATLIKNEEVALRSSWLYKVKQQTENLSSQGLILALAFGERAWLSDKKWQPFQQTATAHLVAISGLHIGLAMWLGFWLAKAGQGLILFLTSGRIASKICKKLALSYRLPRIVGLLIAIGYAYLAGFATPTVRALLAISVVLVLQFSRRHYTAMQLWWRVVCVLLILDPVSVLSSSFWLSILAVLCLIIWYRYFPLNKWQTSGHFFAKICKKMPKSYRLLIALLHLQLGIALLFTPIQLYFFGGISPFSFIANLLIVPLYSLVIVPTILFTLVSNNLFESWRLVDYLIQFSLKFLEPLSYSWIQLNEWQQWQLISLSLFILCFLYAWLNQKLKQYWHFIVGGCVAFNGLFYLYLWQQPKAEWITFDIGQGLAQALVSRNGLQASAVIYDTGSGWNNNSMAKLEILPYLQRKGITVKAVILSHDDNDHAGGAADILNAYPNVKLISSSQKIYANNKPTPCIAGKTWQFGKFQLTSVYPQAVTFEAENANSCVILAEVGKYKILLTGDITKNEEPLFAEKVGKIDFLQVAHHGSKTSTSETFLNQTQPKVAVISAGRWNMWHLPNDRVVERLKQHQVKVLNTAKLGMIQVGFYKDKFKLNIARSGEWYKNFLNYKD